MPRTVFILGAGASIPYGFPSGEKLVELIIEKLGEVLNKKPGNYSPVIAAILNQHNYTKDLVKFREALSKSGTYSIDAFLAVRKEFREIGKILISYILLEFERKCIDERLLYNNNGNWYRYFFNEIRAQNKFDFCIYNFNYDRSLEYYIIEAYRNFYSMEDTQIYQKLQSMNIVHLHGSLGNINEIEDISRLNFGNLSGIEYFEHFEKLSNKIEIIYEVAESKFSKLWEDISVCSNIVFIGFGFDETNMGRIKLENKKFKIPSDKVYATTFKLSQVQVIDRLHTYIRFKEHEFAGMGQPLKINTIDDILISKDESALDFFTNTLSNSVYKMKN